MGIINVGNGISEEVDGPPYVISNKEVLYTGMGAKSRPKMLTQNMATKQAKHNIQINGIRQRYFATPQTTPIRIDGHPFNDFIIKRTAAAQRGDPNDLSVVAIFQDSTGWITSR